MNITYFLFIISFFINTSLVDARVAMINVPVTNCVGQPLAPLHPHESLEKIYNEMPISWAGEKNDINTCPRIRQLLFNEVVDILEEQGNEVLVKVSNFFYINETATAGSNEVWLLKKHLTSLDEIEQSGISLDVLPEPFASRNLDYHNRDVITLTMPYYDPHTKITYSAGTRFVYGANEHGNYQIYFFDVHNKTIACRTVPENICLRSHGKTIEERIRNFITVVKTWARTPHALVPFVWGGSSLASYCYSNYFKKVSITTKAGAMISYWQRIMPTKGPHSGFDSSGLVLRVAQICGIPYFCQNSTTAFKTLRHMHDNEEIENGDLLWVPSGLFIVNDVHRKHNNIIASSGYQTGYGKMVELSLNELFFDIHTYKDLEYALRHHIPLRVKKADGSYSKTIENYAILKLKSVWE